MKNKLYGNKWKIIGSQLGHGGQSEVFPVIDDTGTYQGEYALKRVLNPARHPRFRQEVEAIKRLSHPNIIKLLDHSALDDTDQSSEKQFLVMPTAAGGDLSDPERISLYKGAIDSVLIVAKQIAAGLAAAHSAGIIHRDIKPQNILFPGKGHEIWVADFGICLLREQQRNTPVGEIVGPRAFMAPELEAGGQLDVTPAADVYSLGKVIYYMLSGNVVLPRESLHEDNYKQIFSKGERYQWLHLLLSKMICPLATRLKDMQSVIKGLEKIEDWEKSAHQLPIGQSGLAGIGHLGQQSLETGVKAAENKAARTQEAQTLTAVSENFISWLDGELQKLAAHIGSTGSLKSEVRKISADENLKVGIGHNAAYVGKSGMEITFEDLNDAFSRQHILQFFLCEEYKIHITVRTAGQIPNTPVQPVRDIQLSFIPLYKQRINHQHPKMSALAGYLSAKKFVGQIRGSMLINKILQNRNPRRIPNPEFTRIEMITRSFYSDKSLHRKFKLSEWPAASEQMREILSEAVDVFIDFIKSGANTVGQ